MFAAFFVAASAAIILVLGLIHLTYTFYGPKLHPRDSALKAQLMVVSLKISRETTMWRTWIGFNASHSFGCIFFGLVYGYLALLQSTLLMRSWVLLVVGLALLVGYFMIGRRYWFSVPFRGIALALALYSTGLALNLR